MNGANLGVVTAVLLALASVASASQLTVGNGASVDEDRKN